jgi:polar amino acid transport system substrate-binding protein
MRRAMDSRSIATLLATAALLAGCASPTPMAPAPAEASLASPDIRAALAPTGTLRIAAYAGSPTSLVRRPGSDEPSGMSVDVGRELARRLGLPARIVELERVEQVVEALRSGQADMTITNASAARAALVDFTEPPLVAIELGYLVMPESPVKSIDDVDKPGIRVGVSQGSSSQAALGKAYRVASLVPASSLKVAAELLQERRIEAFATNKGVLFQLADGLPGARVLDGRWGTESLALAVPKGREAGKAWLAEFVTRVRQEGFVQRAAQRAGLRGIAEAQVR